MHTVEDLKEYGNEDHEKIPIELDEINQLVNKVIMHGGIHYGYSCELLDYHRDGFCLQEYMLENKLIEDQVNEMIDRLRNVISKEYNKITKSDIVK